MPSSSTILRHAALRLLEQQHARDEPPLMERAGLAASHVALELMACSGRSVDRPPLVIAGPGNNGGDAFVVARRLQQAGYRPILVFAGEQHRLPPDARLACEAWLAAGGSLIDAIPTLPGSPGLPYPLIIDGLFGIGLKRAPEGKAAHLIAQINALQCPVLALDLPSGLDSETGNVPGIAVRASHTATFIALKPGLLTNDGPDYCGAITIHDLDLAPSIAQIQDGKTLSPALFAKQFRHRAQNSHKGSHGNAGLIGGSPGMAGAALLAGRAALSLGAGRVFVGLLDRLTLDLQQPELMLREAGEILSPTGLLDALAIGPGLGQSTSALELLHRALQAECPLLLDADALNLLATLPEWPDLLQRRRAETLLTPHPTEAARLLGTSTQQIQSNRLAQTQELARRAQAHVLLKGCGSIIAHPDETQPWSINTSGNPGLATAGTGDVLTGMAISLLAQGWPAAEALMAATHLHGAAADACVAAGIGPIGLRAGELIDPARRLLNEWVTQNNESKGHETTSPQIPRGHASLE